MHVALDTHPLYTGRGGVARYVRGLGEGLRQACPDLRVTEVVWPVDNTAFRQPARALRTAWRELVWARTSGPRRLAQSGAQLLHATALPLWTPRDLPQVVTLHDLALLRHPERYRAWQRRRARARLAMAAAADRLVCVSRFTADEARVLLDVPASRLVVVPNGVTPLPAGVPVPGLPDEFFLFVGSLEPGKNLALLAEVWQSARESGHPLPPLVIVGERWSGVARETAADGWIYLGAVPDAALATLYGRARALLFPSRYEGFGLPVVEALAAGCPVVAAPVASLPEVGGEAVHWTPLESPAWRARIEALGRDPAPAADRNAAGRAHAARFTWARCARETVAVWREVVDAA